MINERTLDKIYNCYQESNGISIDTRKLENNEGFFALKGPNFDGNMYVQQALDAGASFAVIDDRNAYIDERTIVVEDSLEALQKLASHHREQLSIPIIGLTGSNGKTTTKELIQRVLATRYRTFATPGNFNNHIGVPLTLLQIDDDVEIAIIELGANHLGEIADLCEICKPTHGMITNVGKDHLEGFGSFEGSLRANSELYDYLLQHHGVVFINTSDKILANMGKRFDQPVTYPGEQDFSRTTFVRADPFVTYINHKYQEVETQLIGAYNFDNIAAALCIGKHFEAQVEAMDQAVIDYQPSNNRSQWISSDRNQILLDAYNANPSSMHAALTSFEQIDGKKMVILGDMYELGAYTESEHTELGNRLKEMALDKVLLIGSHMAYAHEACEGSVYFTDKKNAEEYLEAHNPSDYTILLKASRGLKLETLTELL